MARGRILITGPRRSAAIEIARLRPSEVEQPGPAAA